MLLALDGFVSFSHMPLRVASLLGLGISLLSFLVAGFYFAKKLIRGLNPPGFTTLVVAVFFLAGIQLMTIGVVGESGDARVLLAAGVQPVDPGPGSHF